jgi:serine/threonine protein kinase
MTYALPSVSTISNALLAEGVHDHDHRDLTSACQEGSSKTFVLVGNPGTGKSTLLRQVYRYWRDKRALKDKKKAWWLDLSQNDHRKVDSLEKLAAVQTSATQHMLIEAKESHGRDIVLFIDHLVQLRHSDHFLRQLLLKSILKHCAIILAVNYFSVETVTSCIVDFELFDMRGFKKEDVHEVMLKLGRERNVKSMDRMIDFIRSDTHLLDMCSVPSLIIQVWEAFKNNNCQCPKTTTTLIKDIVDIRVAKASNSESSSETEDHFNCICSLAFKTLDQEEFNEQQFSSLCLDECIPGTGPQIGLGLMQFLKYNGKISCKFIHTTIKKYLAALHIQRQPIFDQAYLTLKIISDHDKKYDPLIIYFCGITHTNSVKTASLNVAKMILYPLLESMADKYSWIEERSQRTNTLMFFLNCLYEAQDPNLIRKFLSRRQHLLTIALDDEILTESKMQILSYCFANSGIKQWQIEAVSEKIYLAEYLNMLVMDHLSSELKSGFKIEVNVGQSFQVSPENVREIPQAKLKSNIYSRLMRELLHRLLQLHAPIKLKSDGSSSSYISLLACDCLKKEVEVNKVLVLEPVMASHWLPVKPKASRSTSSQPGDNPQTHFHMRQEHESQHIEYVLMMTPLPHRIRFTVPITKEKITVHLCSNGSPGFLDSGIEDHLNLNTTPTCVIYQERYFDAQCQKLILPGMPLPKQTQSNALTVAPCVAEVPRSPIQRHGSSERLETTGIPIANADHDRLGQNFVGIFPESVGGAHTLGSPFNCTHGSQSTRQSTHHPQVMRQSALNSGAIVHTAIPDIFALDQTYPLPDETNLIRRGGNGEIFSGIFGGTELIFKKTSYRSREITIHSKLRHQNVIPLLCLMMGEKHASLRRKWTCYHFLPKATGDLARLISDNEENTLKKLKIRYGDNPRQFGLAQGNVKYILSQILRGLVYLHGLNIVHRDVKASNILLTSNCTCTRLLMCTCVRKCDVQIADFDSALQLTDDGLLPVTYTSKTEQNRKVFTVVPVGTTGYRPPECSQHVVANDNGLISPPLTTKVDVWSFGVLMMRLVNGSYGPSSQREVSLPCIYHLIPKLVPHFLDLASTYSIVQY